MISEDAFPRHIFAVLIFLVFFSVARPAAGLVPPDLLTSLGQAHDGRSFFEELHQSTLARGVTVHDWASDAIQRLWLHDDLRQLSSEAGNGTSNATVLQPSRPVFNVSAQCINATAVYLYDLINREPYALQMLDATAKPPAGIMEGNLKWFGAMSQCKNTTVVTKQPSLDFEAHQCLASLISPEAAKDPMTAAFAALTIGICLPTTCTPEDVTNMLNQDLFDLKMYGKLVAYATNCNDDKKLDGLAKGAIFIGSFITLIVVMATIYDIVMKMMMNRSSGNDDIIVTSDELPKNRVVSSLTSKLLLNGPDYHDGDRILLHPDQKLTIIQPQPSKLQQALLAFSLYTNVPKLLSAKHGSGTITCLHGIRLISMTWVVLGHSIAFSVGVMDNVAILGDVMSRFTFQAIRNATVSVDTFFVLSGFLVAYLTLKEMKRNDGKINWLLFYFHRYWRLTVTYAFIMVLYVGISPYLISNPAADSFSADAINCKKSWYTNLLYVNNFFEVKTGCMGWTWYLANDMQFYLISPIILIALFKLPVVGMSLISGLVLCQILSTSLIMHYNNIGGMMSDKTGNYMFMIYMKPYVRVGVYALGMAAGYVLYKTDSKLKINKFLVWLGWLLATALAIATLYMTYTDKLTDPWSLAESQAYESLFRLTWAISICWVILACSTGNGGFVNTLLSWEAFIPLSRLTYTSYMVNLIVEGIFYGNMESTLHYTDLMTVYLYIGNLVCGFMLAFVVTVLIEAPSIALEKVLLGRFR